LPILLEIRKKSGSHTIKGTLLKPSVNRYAVRVRRCP
jgi:hypothetical protein